MTSCDLCGEAKLCTPKRIEHYEYDICLDCWEVLMTRLDGKGRPAWQEREPLLAGPVTAERGPSIEPTPLPGPLPKIWA